MNKTFRTLTLSFIDLFHPKILALLFLPFIFSLILWSTLAWLFYGNMVSIFSAMGSKVIFLENFAQWLHSFDLLGAISFASILAFLLMFLILLPLTFVTALIFTSVFAMPFISAHVRKNYYPHLAISEHRSVANSVLQILKYSLIYLVLWVVTLPLWFVPVLGFITPFILNAYLNSKVYVLDSISDLASPLEIKSLVKNQRSSLFFLGLVVSMTVLIPFFFIIYPVYAGLVFTHFCMGALSDSRRSIL